MFLPCSLLGLSPLKGEIINKNVNQGAIKEAFLIVKNHKCMLAADKILSQLGINLLHKNKHDDKHGHWLIFVCFFPLFASFYRECWGTREGEMDQKQM